MSVFPHPETKCFLDKISLKFSDLGKMFLNSCSHIISVNLLEAVNKDFSIAVILDIGLSIGVDIVLWDDELMVGNRELEAWIQRDCKITIIPKTFGSAECIELQIMGPDIRSLCFDEHSVESDDTGRSSDVSGVRNFEECVPQIQRKGQRIEVRLYTSKPSRSLSLVLVVSVLALGNC